MNELEVAKKRHDVHNLNLRSMLGNRAGVEGIISLIPNPGRVSFDKTGFLATLSPAQARTLPSLIKNRAKSNRELGGQTSPLEVLGPRA